MKTAVQHPANQSTCQPPAGQNRKLLDRVRDAIRVRHHSRRTEQAYVHWIRRFIVFHGVRHPSKMGKGRKMRAVPLMESTFQPRGADQTAYPLSLVRDTIHIA